MSKHNYSQYSNKKQIPEIKEEEVIIIDDLVIDEVPVDVKMESVIEPVKPETPKPEPVKSVVQKPVVGTVFNCSKLNVRSKPASDADIVAVLDVNSEVEIDMSRSAKDWYKVCTAAGVDGFCMRKFIKR